MKTYLFTIFFASSLTFTLGMFFIFDSIRFSIIPSFPNYVHCKHFFAKSAEQIFVDIWSRSQ